MFPPAQAAAAFDPRQPFSRAEARAAGLTAEMLLSRRFHKICWDTYVAAKCRSPRCSGPRPSSDWCRAGRMSAITRRPNCGVRFRRQTAPRTSHCPRPVGDWFAKESAPTTASIQAQTTLRKGVPISTPEQTLLDLAAVGVGLVDLVVVA